MTTRNFIVARLCDNDFGNVLEYALAYIANEYGADLDPGALQEAMVALTTTLSEIRNLSRPPLLRSDPGRYRDYFAGSLRTTYEEHAPTEDHDGGSAAYDVNTRYTWRF